ncbi:heterokaryon incompatibility protein-domain-containing protein [Aspergillus tetrazonus]
MSRWHEPSCETPKVFLEGDAPHCSTCGAGPYGRLNSVGLHPFRIRDLMRYIKIIYRSGVLKNFSLRNASLIDIRSQAVTRQNSISLLIPIGEESAPIYLTVSYMWGGKDRGYTTCKPVYIGPYWDAIMQTRNYHEMLRTARLARKPRIIWVDVICINQQDDVEHAEQVANMAKIYEQCSRVIVYLGQDLVIPVKPGSVLAWRGLHELESDPVSLSSSRHITLAGILSRRYFSRVWVIQELVLSQRAIIRVCGTRPAPWMQHIAQKAVPVQNILGVLRLVSKSQASDPRDKLFGVIGLYPDGASELPPDYSISVQHVFTGFFAYCIIRLKESHLFFRAAGLDTPESTPSWVPNWATDWPIIFTEPAVQTANAISCIKDWLGNDRFAPLQPDPRVRGWQDDQLSTWAEDLFRRCPWYHNATVDANTGALSIYLTHFCALSHRPRQVPLKTRSWSSIFDFCGPRTRFFLVSVSPLYTLIEPNHDCLVDNLNTYKLVAACTHLFLAEFSPIVPVSINSIPFQLDLALVLLEAEMSDVKMEGVATFFPGAICGWDTFPTYYGMHDQKNHSSAGFRAAYLSCVDPQYCPCIVDDFISLSFTSRPKNRPNTRSGYDTTRSIAIRAPGKLAFYQVPGNWQKQHLGRWVDDTFDYKLSGGKLVRRPARFKFGSPLSAVHVRAPMKFVWEAMKCWFSCLADIHGILGCSISELESLLRYGSSEEEHHLIGSVPGDFRDFAGDERTYQVQIV